MTVEVSSRIEQNGVEGEAAAAAAATKATTANNLKGTLAGPTPKRSLSITIQGKPATVSFDDQLFWLNRKAAPTGATASSTSSSNADPLHAYICVPHALVLHSSFIPDSDGGSLLLRLLAPPTNVERSAMPPFRAMKSRAARVAELRRSLDADGVVEPTRRFAAQVTGPCSNLRLVKIEARVDDDASTWAEELMALAYPDTKPYRKLRVLVNPFGGPGKAVQLFNARIQPILEAAGCTVDATVTTHSHHGTEIAASLSLADKYDAIACVSGDGMLHEVLNGLAKRADATEALRIPLVPIPAGSGNAVALNLLGVSQGFNLALASLNAIKGKPMPVDVCSVTQPADPNGSIAAAGAPKQSRPSAARRKSALARKANVTTEATVPEEGQNGTATAASTTPSSSAVSSTAPPPQPTFEVGYSFLSQAIGLWADVDLGTEDMRMLGDTRFVLGFVGGVLANKECEVDVYVKFGEKGTVNKAEMRTRARQAIVDAEREHSGSDGQGAAAASTAAEATALTREERRANSTSTAAALVQAGVRNEPTTSNGGATSPRLAKLRNGSVTDSLSSNGEDGEAREPPVIVPRDPSWHKTLLTGQSDPECGDNLNSQQWYRIQAPISALYGGKIPYVSRDLLQFPFALAHDRCVDLTLVLHGGGRIAKLRGIADAESGAVVYDPAEVYIKCEAYRVVPRLAAGHKRLRKGGLISIDGEQKPYRAFQVEVDDEVQMSFLSLFGRWQVPDVPPPREAAVA